MKRPKILIIFDYGDYDGFKIGNSYDDEDGYLTVDDLNLYGVDSTTFENLDLVLLCGCNTGNTHDALHPENDPIYTICDKLVSCGAKK